MSRERPKPLNLLAAVIAGFALADLVFGAMQTHAWIDMLESHDLDSGRLLGRVLQVAAMAAMALTAWFAVARANRGHDPLDRKLWWSLAFIAGLACVDVTLGLASSLASDDPLYFRLYRHKWFSISIRLIHLSWIAVAAIAAARLARKQAISAAVITLCVAALAFSLLERPFGEQSIRKAMWLQYLVYTAVPALAMLGAAWLCRTAATASAEHPQSAPGIDPAAWSRAADGLQLYRSALIWRLIITFSGYTLLVMAALGRSPGLARFLTWALPLAALATGAVMFAGVVRFGKQPTDSPARTNALFAAAMMAMALLLDFFVLTQVLAAIGADPADGGYRKIRDALEAAESVGPWAMALSFAGVLALLLSLRALATRLADSELASRAAALIVWLLIIGGSVVGLRLWMADMRARDASTGLLLAFVVGIAALIVLLSYVGLVRRVEERLRGATPQAAMPTATLVDD